ncbi:TRAP transporter small permease [Marinobacterium zhoushanense]|nr:TRAP transporter small permease [Marinobacterium zhoushanense]
MNAKAEVFEDVAMPTRVSVIRRQLDKGYSLIIGTGILVAIMINIANVIGRYVFDSSIAWAEETLSFILIWVVFVGAAKVALNNGHLRVELFSDYLKGPLKAVYDFVIWSSICALSLYMANESFKAVSLMYSFGQTSNVAGIPMYIPHAALFLGFMAMAVSTLVNMLEFLLSNKRVG